MNVIEKPKKKINDKIHDFVYKIRITSIHNEKIK